MHLFVCSYTEAIACRRETGRVAQPFPAACRGRPRNPRLHLYGAVNDRREPGGRPIHPFALKTALNGTPSRAEITQHSTECKQAAQPGAHLARHFQSVLLEPSHHRPINAFYARQHSETRRVCQPTLNLNLISPNGPKSLPLDDISKLVSRRVKLTLSVRNSGKRPLNSSRAIQSPEGLGMATAARRQSPAPFPKEAVSPIRPSRENTERSRIPLLNRTAHGSSKPRRLFPTDRIPRNQ